MLGFGEADEWAYLERRTYLVVSPSWEEVLLSPCLSTIDNGHQCTLFRCTVDRGTPASNRHTIYWEDRKRYN